MAACSASCCLLRLSNSSLRLRDFTSCRGYTNSRRWGVAPESNSRTGLWLGNTRLDMVSQKGTLQIGFWGKKKKNLSPHAHKRTGVVKDLTKSWTEDSVSYLWERPAAAHPAGSCRPAVGSSPCGPGAQPAVGLGQSGPGTSGFAWPSETASPPPADSTAPLWLCGAVQCSASQRSGRKVRVWSSCISVVKHLFDSETSNVRIRLPGTVERPFFFYLMQGLSFSGSLPHQGEMFLDSSLCVLRGSGAPLEVSFHQTCSGTSTALTLIYTECTADVS